MGRLQDRFLLLWCTLGSLTVLVSFCLADKAPSFITKPQNLTAKHGDMDKYFRCMANGDPPPDIQWLRDGVHIKPKTKRFLIGILFKSLYIRPILESDTGRYTCEAKNRVGTIYADAYLTVLKDGPPTWSTWPHNVTLFAGQEYTMPCKATGYRSVTYQWTKDGFPVAFDGTILPLSTGPLYFSNVAFSHSGEYQCAARNFRGSVYASAFVKVVKDPSIVSHPSDTLGVIGGTIWLQCGVVGHSMTSVVWMKDGKKISIPLGSRKSVEMKTFPSTVRVYTLTIRRAVMNDTGKYKCVVSNSKGVMESATVIVNLTARAAAVAPKVSVLDSRKIVAKDSYVKLNCIFSGTPLPQVVWYKNGQKLPNKGSVREASKTSLVAILEIQEAVEEDYGLYVCHASNLAGNASGNITLMIRSRPGTPTNLMVNLTSSTTVKVTWTPGHDGGDTVWYTVEYRRNNRSDWTVVEADTNTTIILTSQEGWHMMVFRVWATNKYGSSAPSNEYLVKGKETARKDRSPVGPPRVGAQTSGAAIGGTVGGILILVLVLLILYVLWRKRSAAKMQSALASSPSVRYTTAADHEEDRHSSYSYVTVRHDAAIPQGAQANEYDSLGKPINWEVPKRCLTLGKELGKGHFGKVVRAVMKTKSGNRIVAVKMLRENIDPVHKKDFMAELELMKSLAPHPNIVCLLGCCTKGDSSYIIVEYCSLGNLLDFLRQSQGNRIYSNLAGGSLTLTCRDLLSFMWQIARGMSYLASLKLVHRDLAARNILVDKGNVCKIADFGLARDIYQENQYLKTTEGELPLRWMAYESIFKGITTTESDVWSFGVLMWEVVTLGANPYPGMIREQLISNLHLGYRMPRPPYCSEELYAIIWECWQTDPAVRPTFSMLCRTLNRMLTAEKILIDLSTFNSEYVNAEMEDEAPKSPTSPLVT